ncbi:vacuolar proton translocating ATPase subunit A, putative [Hepatocystis sp. ex Piliocolobus tephrosceles]|nr:vacuolar proton translocating ATPase subunit A, putative [Hepatocystis sp. ex Piliocolobus tephrosceles]
MGIFRSETMKHGTLVLPSDRAREYLDCIGKQVDIQFVDMNEKTMKRQYKKYIQRIDDMERILRFLEENINKLPNVKIKKSKIENFLEHDNIYELDQVEESLNRLYVQFVRFCNNNKDLINERNNAVEEMNVIITAMNQLNPDASKTSIINTKAGRDKSLPFVEPVNEENAFLSSSMVRDGINMMFTNISGVIKTKDQESFSRTVFRALRGNSYTYFQNITNSVEIINTSLSNNNGNVNKSNISNNGDGSNGGNNNNGGGDNSHTYNISYTANKSGNRGSDEENINELKSVFVVYCQGSAQSSIYEKIMKICKAYDVKTYDWPKSYDLAKKRLKELIEIIDDKEKALRAYEEYFVNEIIVLINVVEPNKNSLIEEWKLFCKKERSIYNNLNCFEGSDITLRCDCWYSANDEEKIRHLLINKSSNDLVSALLLSDKVLTPNISPPTYIKTNEFTKTCQAMVDTYGVPRYGEINPAISTIITFPFLFGIMYGDVGHGFCLFMFALFLIVINNKVKNKSNNDMLRMLLDGRYLLLLMGFFAIYVGFLYNDFFAIPLNLFTSMFEIDTVSNGIETYKRRMVIDSATNNQVPASPYIFGFDSKWLGASNELSYINSFKMKLSLIIGFIHMIFGVIMKGCNCVYFKKKLDFFFEFIPQLILMISIVGYLVFLIIYKWATPINYDGFGKQNIISTVINMYLMKELTPSNQFYKYQGIVQAIIIILFVLCIPIMFLCKPIIRSYKLIKERKRTMANANEHYYQYSGNNMNFMNGSNNADKEMTNNFQNNALHMSSSGSASGGGGGGGANASSSFMSKLKIKKGGGGDSKKKKKKITDDEMEAHLLGPSSSSPHDNVYNMHDDSMQPQHKENFSEIWIEQLIETIEFILSLISNTASYLRLWALSLAHQQLSRVFFEQTILNSLKMDDPLFVLLRLVISSPLFSILTIAVILFMDTLECFLHSLRLQWVEFQNKFYKGDGEPFKPFNIYKLLCEEE